MIVLEHASRWYGQVIGLNDVTCRIGPGLTALLGPNGAGKSTLLKLITGQLRPTTGKLEVLNERPFANPKVLARLGYCPEIDNFYEEMTGREFVTQMAALSGFRGQERKTRTDGAIERVGMADRCDRKIAGYSKGMRQRIKVAQAILHEPSILVLDEPLNGLDPIGRQEITDLMLSYAAEGRCVLISSHILYEVEQLTRTILLMQRGRLLAQGAVSAIRDLMDRYPHRITIETDRAREIATELMALPSVLGVRLDKHEPGRVEVETAEPDRFYNDLPGIVLAGGYTVGRFEAPDNNLETVMRRLLDGKAE
ncbi:MAG: ABC transporter ATP-binding protein [Capsulimonadales bacterium]|nr:ABC transporter ATP-binding protein [Capsulimonadales bacterium]